PTDTAAIEARLEQLAEFSVPGFALFLDDIPGTLQHPADREEFGQLTAAQLAVIAPIEAKLAATGRRLAVCPTDYWGRADHPANAVLGAGIAATTRVFWTGRAICSAELDADDAMLFAASPGRRPLYWDNFPVNDVAMTHELHIGPYLGRDARLETLSEGIIA